ncbi:MAG: tetratricopeptide repeat protein, partial [Flavobacteriales bacterium]
LGDHAGAMRDAEELVERTPDDPQAWNMKGDLHLLFGEYVEAVDHYDRAISLDPEASEHLHDKGLALVMNYQLIQGCRDLERAIDMGSERALETHANFCSY